MNINRTWFDSPNKEALMFYCEHGFVCFRGVTDSDQLMGVRQGWASLVEGYAKNIGVSVDTYLSEISQWRDIWKQHQFFYTLLADCLSQYAAWGLELSGVRLLHDQFIRKGSQSGNGLIPWHQDSMYWPTDRTGCATWLAVDDVGLHGGCLELVAGSHQDVPGHPVDFITTDIEFPSDCIVAVPASAGDLVLIKSTVWHRSQPVTTASDRLAHVSFWQPPQTVYVPERSLFHPLHEQVKVSAGEVLNDDEFPVFGQSTKSYGSSKGNTHPAVSKESGMFNIRSQIEQVVQRQTGLSATLGEMLGDATIRQSLAQHFGSIDNTEAECLRVIERVWISAAAFEHHRGRNVFLSAYGEWRSRFGLDG